METSFFKRWVEMMHRTLTEWKWLTDEWHLLQHAAWVIGSVIFQLLMICILPFSAAFFAFISMFGENPKEARELLNRAGISILFVAVVVLVIYVIPNIWYKL